MATRYLVLYDIRYLPGEETDRVTVVCNDLGDRLTPGGRLTETTIELPTSGWGDTEAINGALAEFRKLDPTCDIVTSAQYDELTNPTPAAQARPAKRAK